MTSLTAIIFRMQLFKVSESFIAQQATAFQRYEPVFAGQSHWGPAPSGFKSFASHEGSSGWVRAFSQIIPGDAGLSRSLSPLAPQVLHAHFAVDGVYASFLARKLKIPMITTLHGFDVTRQDISMLTSFRPALVNSVLWRKHLWSSCDRFICVSEHIRRSAIKRGYPEDKLCVHYIGTDTDARKPQPQRCPGTGNIVHVARLTEKKGTIFLIRALAKISESHPQAKLTIIGDGPLRSSLESEVSALGLGNKVSFLGAKPFDETQKYIAGADILALPSITASNGDTEGLPMVTKEAGALGIPLVVTDSGGIAEAVIDGKTGYVVKEKDVDALADRLSRLLADPGMARKIGDHARIQIEENFNIKKQSAKLEGIYDELRTKYR
jgi:glycosyltransferase involved in cell wall biosynthesis